MKDQPLDLNQTSSRSELVSIYKCPWKILGALHKIGVQKTLILHLFATSALNTTYLRTKRRIDKQKW